MQGHSATNRYSLRLFASESEALMCTYCLNKEISFIHPYSCVFSSFHDFFAVQVVNWFLPNEESFTKSLKPFFYEQ